MLPLVLFVIKETRHDTILKHLAKKMRKETGKKICGPGECDSTPATRRILKALTRPVILLFTEPLLWLCTLWSAFAFGISFIFTQSTELVYTALYNWSQAQCGEVQAALVIGQVVAFPASLLSIRLYLQSARRNIEQPGTPIPEARLYVAIFGSLVLSGGMFEFAWTAFPSVPWIVPTIGLGMVGFGQLLIVSAAADYVMDAYAPTGWAGSAISAAAACENLSAGFLPFSTQPMYHSLGIQWASTLLAFISLLVSCAPVLFLFYGKTMRERSRCNRKSRDEMKE